MTQPRHHLEPALQPTRRRNGPIILFGSAFALLALLVGVYLYLDSDGAWEKAVADADADDPNWRFMDLVETRRSFPQAQNGAAAVTVARGFIPANWPSQELTALLNELPPNQTLNRLQLKTLREELDKATAALEPARKVADFPDGRHPIRYKTDLLSTLLPTVQETREVSRLLHHDALLRLESNEIEGALLSCHAMLNAARSLGDEPFMIAQLVRAGVQADMLRTLERVLAQGEPAEALLGAFQKRLEQEEAHPMLLIAAKGERGMLPHILHSIQSGETKIDVVLQVMSDPGRRQGMWETLPYRVAPGKLRGEFGELLAFLNRWVAAARLPEHEQRAAMTRLESEAKELPRTAQSMVPAVLKVTDAFMRSRAELRCAVAALAAERYRLKHGQWPDSPEALVPDFLARPLPDPFDGKPLRLARTAEGLVIYSIGPDGEDHGGQLQRDFPGFKRTTADGVDVGFLLWNPDRRRLHPKNESPEEKP